MPEYVFQGEVTLRGVTFYISADDEANAKELARLGKYDDYDSAGAETSDWGINPKTLTPNF